MKKRTLYIIVFSLIIGLIPKVSAFEAVSTDSKEYEINMKQDILSLMMAYPEHIKDIEKRDNGLVYLVMESGEKILYDDKKNKSFEEKMSNPDLQDMMEEPYPLTAITEIMDKDIDPGRVRHYQLLREVYGNSKGAVEKNLKLANTGYGSFQFNKKNKAAEELTEVFKELPPLLKNNSKVGAFVCPINGTYNYRVISGTGRLSPHAFGIAIDLVRDRRDYWKWVSREEGQKRLEAYPKELVELFEKHNFVWGGKWSHFDILHFEYRPEIILKARYFGKEKKYDKNWYNEKDFKEEKIKAYIEKLESIF